MMQAIIQNQTRSSSQYNAPTTLPQDLQTETKSQEQGAASNQDQQNPNAAMAQSRVQRVKSSLVSRNVTIAGHRTSVRLEPEMWNGMSEICRRECASMHEICTAVAAHKPNGTSLTAAIRVFVMAYFRAAATEEGHNRAGHGPGGHLMMSLRGQDRRR